EDQAIAGLLHDSIEDQGVTDEDIASRFGDRVAAIVRACTDAETFPKPPWHARKVAYIEHLAHSPSDSLLVSLADKVHNGRALAADVARDGDAYFERFAGGAAGTRWYYRRLADAFAARADLNAPSLLAEYAAVIERFGATKAAAATYERSSKR